ncbi:MAG: ABC transporter permease subunit, partial [Roseicyclus sp.]
SAYAAEIFYGALRSVPKGDLEAADAYGLSGWKKFRRITFPTTMRLAWPAYTNEAIFLFHATALVFFSSFPAFQQRGDALYYANYFADRTFNPFIPYPIVAVYFVLLTLCIIWLFGAINTRLNRHLPSDQRRKLRIRPQVIR